MPGIDFEQAKALALALPEVIEASSYGAPAFKRKARLIACVPSNKTAEPGSLVVRIDPAQRDDLLAAKPQVYYLPDHYVAHPYILIRLGRITRKEFEQRLHHAWEQAALPTPRKTTKQASAPVRRPRS